MATLAILNVSSILQTVTILLAVTACLPAQGAVLRHRRDTNRVECTTAKSQCQYYSHCINANFPCGHDGFLLSYAQKRCELIDNLEFKHPRKTCKTPPCVELNTIEWAHKSEDCLKSALDNLNSEFEKKGVRSDPSTCLSWEQQAIQKMNQCYREAWKAHPLSDEDARALTNLFRIEEYFDNAVDRGIPSIVMQLNNLTNTNALHSNRSYDRRLFCIKGTGNHPEEGDRDLTSEEVLSVVDKALEGQSIPYQYFYNGMDSLYDEQPCITYEPANINVGLFDYHLVTLLVPPNTTVNQPTFQTVINTPTSRFAATLYQLSTQVVEDSAFSVLRFSQCGDGIRQAGEECDYGGVTEGCSPDCKVISGYDCSIDKMQPSICWPEVCGDGKRTRSEECDDNNKDNGDGCNSECRLEKSTHSCATPYNATSTCQACPCTDAEQLVKLAPNAPSYITARRLSLSQSKALAGTKRTIQLPAEASSASSVSPLSLTTSVIFAVAMAIVINLDLWR